MYRRFLNDSDYLSLLTPEALSQITRNDTGRFIQAEEAAEMSIVEYLSENYEVVQELNRGKQSAVIKCLHWSNTGKNIWTRTWIWKR